MRAADFASLAADATVRPPSHYSLTWRISLNEPSFVHVTAAVEHVVTSIGIFAAGYWAWRKFRTTRSGESALEIELAAQSLPATAERHFVHLDVVLKNKGNVRLGATRTVPAFQELAGKGAEKVQYALDLQLRPLLAAEASAPVVPWFSQMRDGRAGTVEVDMLELYREAESGCVDFWMEPGETSHLSAVLSLERGCYLAVVTFVGENQVEEFWRRQFLVQVPVPAPS